MEKIMSSSYKYVSNTSSTVSGYPYGTYTYNPTYYQPITYKDSTLPNNYIGSYSTTLKEESPDEVFNKKKIILSKDGKNVVLTYAELYEFKKLNKHPEELTEKEITDILLVLRI